MQNVSKTAGDTMRTVSEGAEHARTSLLEFGTHALKFVNSLAAIEMRAADSLLRRVGLQRRGSGPSPVVWFAAGGLIAGGTIIALSPRTRKELGDRIARLFDAGTDLSKKGIETAEQLGKTVESKVERAYDDARKTVASAAKKVESKVEDTVHAAKNGSAGADTGTGAPQDIRSGHIR